MTLKGTVGNPLGDDLKTVQIPELYVETSVVNGVFSRDKRIATVSLIFFEKIQTKQIKGHISSYVLAEIYETTSIDKRNKLLSLASLCLNDAPSGPNIEETGKEYVRRGMIPAKYILDAHHIASASHGKFEALVTWNYEHILRDKTEKLLRTINKELRLYTPQLKSPEVYIW